MADKPVKRTRSDMPTQAGTPSALSSSADNIFPGHIPSPPPGPPTRGTGATPPLPGGQETYVPGDSQATSPGVRQGSRSGAGAYQDDTSLEPGAIIATRYEILEVLGRGGMGSVYKARDLELDRLVALKVIRPELARNTAIVERFKQELRLSHQVTHRNVIRMYDLGEDAGMRFITMEMVEGRDLRSIIEERGKLPPEETVEILQQICYALEAAHAVGILHRDLKPQNIMIDSTGRVVVMDFGLARTIEGDGMTQSGAIVGTMEYMSPEQALGKNLDQRSDIFALGLICYEMLTGNMPYRAESALASLIKRTRERAEPVTVQDPTIPGQLSGIVSKCLETDVEQRYKNTGEILRDLEAWRSQVAGASLRFNADLASTLPNNRWIRYAGAGALVLVLAVGGAVVFKEVGKPHTPAAQTAKGPALSLAIMPFYNASGDPSLNWLGSSLADMLGGDIGQSANVRTVSPDRLHQALHDLRISGSSQVDVATLRRVAEFTNASTVIFGQYVKPGSQIRIETTILDLASDSRTVLQTDVPDEKQLLNSVDALAGEVRQKLAANPDMLNELKAHAQRPSTNSVEALRAYTDGLQLARKGNNIDALTQLQAATAADPEFALAFAKLGEIYSELGHDDQAQTASRRAVELSDSLPASEKYLIEANNARINKDTEKAIAAYEKLAADNPGDTDVQFALADLYEKAGNFPSAKQRLAAVLANDPKNVAALLASGRVAIRSGDPQGGLDFLSRALTLAIQFDNVEQKAVILQATGVAYRLLNNPQEALRNYEESLAIKKQIGDKHGAAASLEEIASIQDSTGFPDAALASYKQSLALRREIGDQAGIANTLLDMGSFYHDHGKPGDELKYMTDALQIARDLGDQSMQALCLNNIGSIKLDNGEYQDALTYLEQGYQLREKLNVPQDVADSQHNLAEANTKLGQYDAALALYLKAIATRHSINDQRGVAIESDSMARIFADQGRYGAALSSMKDALQIFQQTKEMTSFTVEIVGGWGDLLAQVGRGEEGRSSLESALSTAHQIKDQASVALATNWMGDSYYYKGDNAAARTQYEEAFEIASKAGNKERVLLARVNKAKIELAVGRAAAVAPELKKLAQDADTLGLKSVSVECSIDLGQALIAAKNASGARQQLDMALARAEKLGLRMLQAKAHYQIATLLVQTGKSSEATPHYREVVRILESISKEDNSGHVLERADIQSIYRDSTKSFQGSN
ncbi:serine/threonine protein kinase/tetratricopeptide (TPR) repeat protein [Silvibacterium bohemicum]|uniref:non-specific serine/threonine protein kinase n=1 Tax=Silvibacterium bohemicum TaxID=1577686 RepID=A0A841K2L3_9BACT|nr:serine/threonine-protein kinase [Silvibacterium bohemicum]MBB6146159.1 serine/threonine protein kinase/tetratricopeptide (TPR) repeat protein [Silvibacterium bohemicum]